MAETYSFEDRQYIEPTVSRDEQLGFIDRLREIENKDLRKIATDTHNLGSDLPSNLGGLSGIGQPNSLGISGADAGSAGIWRNRYERPQTNALVADLKATAQASALDTALNNMLNQYKNRYNQAARKAAKAGTGNTTSGNEDPWNKQELDDYMNAVTVGVVGGQDGNYFAVDKNGNINVIGIGTDADKKILGVAAKDRTYGGTPASRTDAVNYIQNLIDSGVTFWNSNGQQVLINPGA